MPDEAQSDNDLFSTRTDVAVAKASAAILAATTEGRDDEQPTDLKAKFEALVHAHFPDLDAGGFEAHQPLRAFLLDLHALLP